MSTLAFFGSFDFQIAENGALLSGEEDDIC